MYWRLILEEFGPNVHHIAVVYNIVTDTLSRLLSLNRKNYDSCTRKSQCRANYLFPIGRLEKNKELFPPNLLIVQIEQQK